MTEHMGQAEAPGIGIPSAPSQKRVSNSTLEAFDRHVKGINEYNRNYHEAFEMLKHLPASNKVAIKRTLFEQGDIFACAALSG